MGSPRLSVVMSVFNSERWLLEALESILGQSFSDFEFIAIDDCSTDGSPAILERAGRGHSRIVLLRNERNLGLTVSLNRGLSAARGEYLARMDSDDSSLPGRFAAQVDFLDRNPEVGLLGGGIRIIDEAGKPLGERIPPLGDTALRAELLVKNNAFAHSTVMARTALLKEAGGYDKNFRYAQDYDLWQRLGTKTRFACLSGPVVEWRSSHEGISLRHRKEQLECIWRVSCREIELVLGPGNLDFEAYRRVWWAYHGDFGMFRKGDIELLEPLWSYFASQTSRPTITLSGFADLAYNLVGESFRGDGGLLLGILQRRLGLQSSRYRLLRKTLRSLLPKSLPGK